MYDKKESTYKLAFWSLVALYLFIIIAISYMLLN